MQGQTSSAAIEPGAFPFLDALCERIRIDLPCRFSVGEELLGFSYGTVSVVFSTDDRPTYAVNEEPQTESEVLVCDRKMKVGKSGGDDRIGAEMLEYLLPSMIREMTKIIRLTDIDKRISDP
ncbi:hypothetical protein RB195_023722 [Necator americanus]|uniref:Uncharacterized protein n=1 Tax=Necator americanus TaxID=51031 RepID=A0ABR1EKB0_NECAM